MGIFGPPETLYQGGYYRVSFPERKSRCFLLLRLLDDIRRQIRCFRAQKKRKKLCNELFQGPRRNLFRRFIFYFAVNSLCSSSCSYLLSLPLRRHVLLLVFHLMKIFYVNGLIINGTRRSERERTAYSEHSRLVTMTFGGRSAALDPVNTTFASQLPRSCLRRTSTRVPLTMTMTFIYLREGRIKISLFFVFLLFRLSGKALFFSSLHRQAVRTRSSSYPKTCSTMKNRYENKG